MSEECDVILVFVNNNEKEAVYNAFKEKPTRDPVVTFGEVLTYHDFGSIGGAKVLGLQIEMGSTTPGGSAAAISEVLNEKNPQYVILVGIAFGMNRKKLKIGDILLSQKLSQYEVKKIGTHKKGEEIEDIEILRGDTITAPERILGRFRALSGANYWQGAPVHFGLMLSGEKLIDNPKSKGKLQKEYPEAIGGEMEAAGAYAAASLKKRDWIVVKAVCDYADGTKKHNKQKNQEIAAKNAARFVFNVLEQGNFGDIFSLSGKKEKKKEEKTPSSRAAIKTLVNALGDRQSPTVMADDIKIIKQIEKQIGKELKQLTPKNIMKLENNGYVPNEADQVQGLNLDGTKITDLTPLRTLTNLKNLELRNNKIEDITPLAALTHLERLILINNKISDISPLSGLIELKTISLSDNKIIDLSPLTYLTSLTNLQLNKNKINDLTPLRALTQLEILGVRINRINDLIPLKELSNLTGLDASINKITTLPPDIDRWWSSMEIIWEDNNTNEDLNLFGNLLTVPPVEIVKQGMAAVENYFDITPGFSLGDRQSSIRPGRWNR